MSIATLRTRFDTLLSSINGSTSTNFSTTAETAYEALALAAVMQEYVKVYGPVNNLIHPSHNQFLNQKPGMFRTERSFKIEFQLGAAFYFAADLEVFGLNAFMTRRPTGILFEADVVVIPEGCANDIINNYRRYPAPQHIDSAYECKFGNYEKGQLRELLGLKRHLCFLAAGSLSQKPQLFSQTIENSRPDIPLKMIRPKRTKFFDNNTAALYDLEQVIVPI